MTEVCERIRPCPRCQSMETCGVVFFERKSEEREVVRHPPIRVDVAKATVAAFCSDCALELTAARKFDGFGGANAETWTLRAYEMLKSVWIVGPPQWLRTGISINGEWQIGDELVQADFTFRQDTEDSLARSKRGLLARYTCHALGVKWTDARNLS